MSTRWALLATFALAVSSLGSLAQSSNWGDPLCSGLYSTQHAVSLAPGGIYELPLSIDCPGADGYSLESLAIGAFPVDRRGRTRKPDDTYTFRVVEADTYEEIGYAAYGGRAETSVFSEPGMGDHMICFGGLGAPPVPNDVDWVVIVERSPRGNRSVDLVITTWGGISAN